jgi:ribosomal protein S18 acetylase RimI-like enzyme
MNWLIPGYSLQVGTVKDQPQLTDYLRLTYESFAPARNFEHLEETVIRHLSDETPLWWVRSQPPESSSDAATDTAPIACLWLGRSIDQATGDLCLYVFLLYVDPAHRRRGIATALMSLAQTWAKQQGYPRIGLQVHAHNTAAIALYRSLGYGTESLWLGKVIGG